MPTIPLVLRFHDMHRQGTPLRARRSAKWGALDALRFVVHKALLEGGSSFMSLATADALDALVGNVYTRRPCTLCPIMQK